MVSKVKKIDVEGKESKMPYYCTQCTATFTEKLGLEHHIENVHDSKKYKCTICSDCFPKKGMLRKHLGTVHEGQKPYQCSLCNAGFPLNPHLRPNMWVVGLTQKGSNEIFSLCIVPRKLHLLNLYSAIKIKISSKI